MPLQCPSTDWHGFFAMLVQCLKNPVTCSSHAHASNQPDRYPVMHLQRPPPVFSRAATRRNTSAASYWPHRSRQPPSLSLCGTGECINGSFEAVQTVLAVQNVLGSPLQCYSLVLSAPCGSKTCGSSGLSGGGCTGPAAVKLCKLRRPLQHVPDSTMRPECHDCNESQQVLCWQVVRPCAPGRRLLPSGSLWGHSHH